MERNFEDGAETAMAVKLDLFVHFRFTTRPGDALNNTNACRILDGIRADDVAWHYENTGYAEVKSRCRSRDTNYIGNSFKLS